MRLRPTLQRTLPLAAVLCALTAPAQAHAARYATRTLTVGSHGSDVSKLQRYLTKAGHRTSRDGSFGTRTGRALRATERDLELGANGRATPREQRRIRLAVRPASSGGAQYVPPAPKTLVTPTAHATLTPDGFARSPENAPPSVKAAIAAANTIARTPYKWGGGHRGWADSGYDCSGSVSYVLHSAGLLSSPLVSGDFGTWGRAGNGRWMTIYSNADHVYMYVAGVRYDTSARAASGSRWSTAPRSNAGFAVSHPTGL